MSPSESCAYCVMPMEAEVPFAMTHSCSLCICDRRDKPSFLKLPLREIGASARRSKSLASVKRRGYNLSATPWPRTSTAAPSRGRKSGGTYTSAMFFFRMAQASAGDIANSHPRDPARGILTSQCRGCLFEAGNTLEGPGFACSRARGQ